MNIREFLEEQYKAGLIELPVYTRGLRSLQASAQVEHVLLSNKINEACDDYEARNSSAPNIGRTYSYKGNDYCVENLILDKTNYDTRG
jgi:hypothetical protein